jgi:hypothetical protein
LQTDHCLNNSGPAMWGIDEIGHAGGLGKKSIEIIIEIKKNFQRRRLPAGDICF